MNVSKSSRFVSSASVADWARDNFPAGHASRRLRRSWPSVPTWGKRILFCCKRTYSICNLATGICALYVDGVSAPVGVRLLKSYPSASAPRPYPPSPYPVLDDSTVHAQNHGIASQKYAHFRASDQNASSSAHGGITNHKELKEHRRIRGSSPVLLLSLASIPASATYLYAFRHGRCRDLRAIA